MGEAGERRTRKDGARKERHDAFGKARKARFLQALAATCNVQKSCAFAGVHKVTAYAHRKTDAEFRAAWQEALAAGYDRLEALALEAAGAGGAIDPGDPDAAAGQPFDFEKAMVLLRHHRTGRRTGEVRSGAGPRPKAATREETNEALIKAIRAVRRRIAMEVARGE